MRKFGLSAAVVMALAAPAWAQYPPQFAPDGFPTPAGLPIPGGQPNPYPFNPNLFAGGNAPPDMLPPITMPPGGPMAPPGLAPPGADSCGFPYDPCYQCDPVRRCRGVVVPAEAWVKGEWLNWNFRDAPVPPLIVSGNPAVPFAGIPGGGNYTPLVGPTRDLGRFNGARLTIGHWFDPDGELGGEVSAFIFERRGTADFFQGSAARSLGVPVLATDGMIGLYDFSFPGQFAGSLGVRTATQLWGGEANLLRRWYGDGCVSVDGIFGYRYLQLNERLELFGRAQSAGATPTFTGARLPVGVTVFTSDSFRVCNEFHGVQFGSRFEFRRGMFTLTGYGKGGMGINLETLRAEGVTRATGFGITRTSLGGLRVLGTNFGRDTENDFCWLGETGVELGLQVSKNVSVRVGYNLLWLSDVVRPGTVVSPIVTRSQVPIDQSFNPAAPATAPTTGFRTSDFLAHGLVVGVMIDW